MDSSTPYIAVTGPVGAGKTTLAREIARRLEARVVCEEFEANPFLIESAQDPKAFAFETAAHFLLLHMHQLKKAQLERQDRRPMVSDFHLPHDRFFALHELEESNLGAYDQLLAHAVASSPQPRLILALDVSWKTCWTRISERERPHELDLGPAFFEPIYGHFSHWIETADNSNILRIDFENSQLLESDESLRQLAMEIRHRMGA